MGPFRLEDLDVDFLNDPETLGTHFAAESWRGWKTIAKAIYGEKLTKKETEFFKSIGGRSRSA